MAKRKALHCYACNNTYYAMGKRDRECPYCEERKLKETNPKAYKEWLAAKSRNNDMDRAMSDCNNLIDHLKGPLKISLPVLLIISVLTILNYDLQGFMEDIEAVAAVLIISVMLIWAIKLARRIFMHDYSLWEVRTGDGDFIRNEIGDKGIFGASIIGAFILIFLIYKYFIKSGTDGYITRLCIVGFSMYALELLINLIELILVIRAKIKVSKYKKKMARLSDYI